MRILRPRLSKPTTFAILMSVSLVAALLPTGWTGWVRGVVQPLGWLEWATSSAARKADEAAGRIADRASTPLETQLREQAARLRFQLGHQSLLIGELERRLADVSGIQDRLGPARARIIIAAVVSADASPRRDTITINKGSVTGVTAGQWVAAGAPHRKRDPEATGRELLLREWIVGRVIDSRPYTSQVELATDVHFGPLRVRAAEPRPDGTWRLADRDCLLYGRGGGRMRIEKATEDYPASGFSVVVVPVTGVLPTALTIGRIESSEPLPESALHYNLDVRPWYDPRKLSHVYVISLER